MWTLILLDGLPTGLPMANHQDAFYSGYEVGNFVALADSDDPSDDRYHVAEIISNADNRIRLRNYATTSTNINNATWQPLFQHRDGRYRRGGRKSKHWDYVVDEIDAESETDFPYIRHHQLRLLDSGRLTAKSKLQLRKSGLKHHVLGRSFP